MKRSMLLGLMVAGLAVSLGTKTALAQQGCGNFAPGYGGYGYSTNYAPVYAPSYSTGGYGSYYGGYGHSHGHVIPQAYYGTPHSAYHGSYSGHGWQGGHSYHAPAYHHGYSSHHGHH